MRHSKAPKLPKKLAGVAHRYVICVGAITAICSQRIAVIQQCHNGHLPRPNLEWGLGEMKSQGPLCLNQMKLIVAAMQEAQANEWDNSSPKYVVGMGWMKTMDVGVKGGMVSMI